MFTSGCYGGGYPISAAACGEGTINVCLGAAGNASATSHAYAYAYTFAFAHANANPHSHANTLAHTSR